MKGKPVVLLVVGILVFVILVAKALPILIGWINPYGLSGSDWSIFKRNFISPEGRVIDTGNGNISHSEGQGYAMVIATAYGDRKTFDRIWKWTQENLQTRPNDKLLSWLWKPDGSGGAVADPNNASDGDLLVAWALVRGSKLWKEYSYQQSAAQILADLARLDVHQAPGGPYLLPGTDGFLEKDSITLNPSYYIFPALSELAAAFPGSPWGEISTAGQAFIEKARFGKWNLTPDWATLRFAAAPAATPEPTPESQPISDQAQPDPSPVDAQPSPTASEVATASPSPTATPTPSQEALATPSPAESPAASVAPVAETTPAASPEPSASPQASPEEQVASAEPTVELSKKFPPIFGYNAIRVPLHLAWQNPESPLLQPFAEFWKSLGSDLVPATVNLEDNSFGADPALPGMRAVGAYTTACVEKRNLTVRAIPELTKGDSYFSASLTLLTKIAVRESFGKK